jgi:hypothetical protein
MESFMSILMKEAPVLKVLRALVALMADSPIRHSRRAWTLKGQPFKDRIRHSETFVARRAICLLRPDRRLPKFAGVRQVID